MSTSDEVLAQIREALIHGRKIEAIKLYRESTGAGLAEAKNAVEAFEKEWRAATPEQFTTSPGGKGCSTLVVALGVTMTFLSLWIFGR